MPPRARTAYFVALAVSLLAIFWALFAYGLSALQEHRSQRLLYSQFRGLLAPTSTVAPPVGGAIAPGTPVALLSIPAAGVADEVVVEGTSSSDLLAGPGHLRDSPLPGQAGQSVLLGRQAVAGGPFGGIERLHAGDPITVRTGQGLFRYSVLDVRRAGDPRPAMPAGGSLLTLVTAAGSGWLGHLAPTHVVYVDAALKGTPQPVPAGLPVAVPTAELPGQGDPSAWPILALWAVALVAAVAGAVVSWLRWGRRLTWLIAVPVVFGLLWAVAETGVRLLPNIL